MMSASRLTRTAALLLTAWVVWGGAPRISAACAAPASVVALDIDWRTVMTVRRCVANGSGRAAGGPILNGDFRFDLTDWTAAESGGSVAPGGVSADAGQALMLEGDSFLVTLEQPFAVGTAAFELDFSLFLAPGFDPSDSFLPDAFEATLLDATTGLPAVPPWDAGATSFFNMQEDGTVFLGSGTSWNGTTATVDLSGLAAGIELILYFDLIGGDGDTNGGVRVDDAFDCSDADGDTVVTCVDNCAYVANSSQSDLDLDGIGDVCDPCTDVDGDGAGVPASSACPIPFEDCDNLNPNAAPDGRAEDCDGFDNDCNGLTDEGNPDGGGTCATGQLGVCASGTTFCDGGGLVCVADAGPGCEICGNSLDDDCDGVIDETTDDFDGDGVTDCDDNCCDAHNPSQEDADMNGIGDACDCSSVPAVGATVTVSHAATTEISWEAVTGIGTYHVYRGYRSPAEPFAYNQQCLAPNVGGTLAVDPLDPLSSNTFYYMVASKCAVGEVQSTLGNDSSAMTRPVFLVCPDPASDLDGDGTEEAIDNCPGLANAAQSDVDSDSRGDVCDNCTAEPNPIQEDLDMDGLGDACDPDRDGDGIPEDFDDNPGTFDPCTGGATAMCDDNCPSTSNPGQEDGDADGIGDACDPS